MAISEFNDNVFWLKNKLFRRDAIALYKEAMRNQSLSPEELKEACFEKRVRLVRFAYENIPFYRQYYDECGFHPDNLKSEEDWNKIPILEKSYVRNQAQDMLNPYAKKKDIGETTTGGSTGMPLKVYRDKRFKLETLGWRAFSWWGVSPADNTGITHRRVPRGLKALLANRLLWWPTKRIYISATSMSDCEVKKFVEDINRKRIVWLTGYVGALETIANYIIKNDVTISTLRLVWSTSAPLSKSVREKLERAFRCRVMNQYGSCEVSNIAQQCPHSEHLHINCDFVHVDIVDENGAALCDEEGDILVTDLSNYVFPLIRYRLGDRGCLVQEQCSCGVSLPLMKNVKGRISDAVYTPSGVYVDGNYLTTIFDNYSEVIEQFQVRQFDDYSITIYVRKNPNADISAVLEKIRTQITADVKGEVPVRMELVDEIKHDRGKIRYILSDVALSKVK